MVYAQKFPPITPVKAFLKFESIIYSDIDFQSAISASSTGNSQSFTELTDRLAFVNFSSPVSYDTERLKFHTLYHISSVIRQSFFLPKQSQRSRSILQDGSRSFGIV